MNFHCETLSITDDPDFGCTISFSEGKTENEQFKSMNELLHPTEKYLLIQRSYPEDEDETDWYTVESSEDSSGFSQNEKIVIWKLNKELIEISWGGASVTIGTDLSDKRITESKQMLKQRFNSHIYFMRQ